MLHKLKETGDFDQMKLELTQDEELRKLFGVHLMPPKSSSTTRRQRTADINGGRVPNQH